MWFFYTWCERQWFLRDQFNEKFDQILGIQILNEWDKRFVKNKYDLQNEKNWFDAVLLMLNLFHPYTMRLFSGINFPNKYLFYRAKTFPGGIGVVRNKLINAKANQLAMLHEFTDSRGVTF